MYGQHGSTPNQSTIYPQTLLSHPILLHPIHTHTHTHTPSLPLTHTPSLPHTHSHTHGLFLSNCGCIFLKQLVILCGVIITNRPDTTGSFISASGWCIEPRNNIHTLLCPCSAWLIEDHTIFSCLFYHVKPM